MGEMRLIPTTKATILKKENFSPIQEIPVSSAISLFFAKRKRFARVRYAIRELGPK